MALRRLSFAVRRREHERELNDEMTHHHALLVRDGLATGLPQEEAEARANVRFGNATVFREESRDMWTLPTLESVGQDLRYAARTMRRSRGTTLTAIGTLAAGIALVTTFFSVFNAAAFRPAPYPGGSRILALSESNAKQYVGFSGMSVPAVDAVKHSATAFSRVAAFQELPVRLTLPGGTQSMMGTYVDSGAFALLQVPPRMGRVFTPAEIAGDLPVAVISDSLWRTQLNAQPNVLGRSLRMDGRDYTVVGVMPRGFRFYLRSDVWLPLVSHSESSSQLARDFTAIGRLNPGASAADASRQLALIGQRLRATDSTHFAGWSLVVRDGMADRNQGGFLQIGKLLTIAALLVLLIACSNVANLLLARAVVRRPEMAMRASLGASRARLIRQGLTESTLLAVGAGVVGTVGAYWMDRILLAVVPTSGFPTWLRVGIDLRVLVFAFGVSLLTVAVFGLLPALEGTRMDPVQALKSGAVGGLSTSGSRRHGRVVIVIELALSVVLFTAAALVGRTYLKLSHVNPNYDATQVARVYANLNEAAYPDAASHTRFLQTLGERLRRDPAVASVAYDGTFESLVVDSARVRQDSAQRVAHREPLAYFLDLYLPGHDSASTNFRFGTDPDIDVVNDGYFGTLGIRVVAGRGFAAGDVSGAPPVAVVSQLIANLLWPGASPLGQTFRIGKDRTPTSVIGVVSDVIEPSSQRTHSFAGAAPAPIVYVSERQGVAHWRGLLVRGHVSAAAVAQPIASAVRAIDPDQAVMSESLSHPLETNLLLVRLLGGVFGVLALSALVLAMVGIYGVIAYAVGQRSREVGIRMALGATTSDVVRLVMREGVRFTIAGLALGVVLALLLTRTIRVLFWGVSPADPLTYAIVCLVFGAVALLACYLPARRAARVDPLEALRSE